VKLVILESKDYLGKYVYYTIQHTICCHVKYWEGWTVSFCADLL